MIRVEHDTVSGALLYAGWALPGAADGDAAWRIAKFLWSGMVLSAVQWADGNFNLDNVWANRASLAYSANAALALDAAGVVDVVPSGIPGSSLSVGFTIPDRAELWLNSTPMQRVGSGPVGNQVVVSGSSMTTGVAVGVGDWCYLRVPL